MTFVTFRAINYIFSVGVVTIAVNSASEMYTGEYVPPALDNFFVKRPQVVPTTLIQEIIHQFYILIIRHGN